MPISSSRECNVWYSLASDCAEPEDTRPALRFRHFTAADWLAFKAARALAATNVTAETSEADRKAIEGARVAAVESNLAGWNNIRADDPTIAKACGVEPVGEGPWPIPFKRGIIDHLFTLTEQWEILQNVPTLLFQDEATRRGLKQATIAVPVPGTE